MKCFSPLRPFGTSSREWFLCTIADEAGAQGFGWSESSIWLGVDLPPAGVRPHRRHIPPFPVLVLATAVPAIMGTLGEHTRHTQRRICHPARDGDQLLVLVPRRIRVPIPHPEAQFRVVDQVQLRDERGDG